MPTITSFLNQYRNTIILFALGVGAIAYVDLSGLYDIGLSSLDKYMLYGMLAIIIVAAYLHYQYINRPRPRMGGQDPMQSGDYIQQLGDIKPPEMNYGGR